MLAPDAELFSTEVVDLPFSDEGGSIREFAAGGNKFVCVLDKPGGDWEVAMVDPLEGCVTLLSKDDRKDAAVYKVFIHPKDPSHVLISLSNGDVMHVAVPAGAFSPRARGANGPKVTKLHSGVKVEAVGWNKANPEGCMVFGDDHGHIYEAQLGKRCRVAFNVNSLAPVRGRPQGPIASIHIEPIRAPGASYTYSERMLLLVGLPCGGFEAPATLLELTMPSSFGYTPFEPDVLEPKIACVDKRTKTSDIYLYRHRLDAAPQAFAWVLPTGILHGVVDMTELTQKGKGPVLVNTKELRFEDPRRIDDLVGLLVTEHYFFLLYPDELRVVSQPPGVEAPTPEGSRSALLTEEALQQRTLWRTKFQRSPHTEAQSLAWDVESNMLYVQSRKYVTEVNVAITNTMPLWKSMLLRTREAQESAENRKTYRKIAEHLCAGDERKMRRVKLAEADALFEEAEYGPAARLYAEYAGSFEAVAIKFQEKAPKEMLLEFLRRRLAKIEGYREAGEDTREATQEVCLVTWIVLTYVSLMNAATGYEFEDWQTEFRDFLDSMEKTEWFEFAVVQDLVATLSTSEEMTYLAGLRESSRAQLVQQHVFDSKFDEAIGCLLDYCAASRCLIMKDGKKQIHASRRNRYEKMWYEYSPQLILHDPERIVRGWKLNAAIGQEEFLKPPKLLPALIKYEQKYPTGPTGPNHGIKYLQWLVDNNNSDQCVHNLLLSMYARQKDDKELMQYMGKKDGMGGGPHYDSSYALRLCLAERKHRAAVFLYEHLQLYEDAVACALDSADIALAKDVAMRAAEASLGMGKEAAHRTKRLWIKIGRHIVEKHGAPDAIAMLEDARQQMQQGKLAAPVDLVLEDLLPYFPDFATIRGFKEEVLSTLRGYDQQMQHARREEMKIEKAAKQVKANEDEFARKRFAWVHAARKCCVCKQYVLTDSFFIFPRCDHVFHEHCLLKQVEQHRQDQLAHYLHTLPVKTRVSEAESKNIAASIVAKWNDPTFALRDEVEDFLAEECYMCGDTMVEEIRTPFISGRDALRLEKSWDIPQPQNRHFAQGAKGLPRIVPV
eukprot:TRINITY_DN27325_c0_g1_i1.p1 TRINITY_DN27325_c0_g1~~TRINITY_DN27325_c0_g1_i1.p1  ORF type:complete len:1061 (+),score=453.58 TRINITY_DN27325_c0_g1_i1:10-3192(+)